MTITLALFFAALTLLLSFVIANEASQFGCAVAVRFLERGSLIPTDNIPLTADNLDRWRSAPQNNASVHGYASRVIPLDIAFLLSFGCFFGFASAALAGQIAIADSRIILFWIFPALYMISDFIEDMSIRQVLLSPSPLASNFSFMRRMTAAKMITSVLCFLQIFGLLICSALR
jgi:hypothetical protein